MSVHNAALLYESLKGGRPLKVEQKRHRINIGWWTDDPNVSRSLASGDVAFQGDSLAEVIEKMLEFIVYGEEEFHRRRK